MLSFKRPRLRMRGSPAVVVLASFALCGPLLACSGEDASGGDDIASTGGGSPTASGGTGGGAMSTGGVSTSTGGTVTSNTGGASTASGGTGGTSEGTGGAMSGGTGGTGGAMSGGTGGNETGTGGASGSATGCLPGNPHAFFVDTTAGKDSNDGKSPDHAWQSLARVNSQVFQPGDALCFTAGQRWQGQLAPLGSGTDGSPIVIAQYGEGQRPRIDAGAKDLQALLLFNVQFWEVNDLEITNDKNAPGDYRGILVQGKDVGELKHIYIQNTYVHDVTGHVYWIGGDAADSKLPWIKFKTGWDASKRTGGIVFEVTSDKGTKTWFNDVLIEGNTVSDTSFGGIVFKQFDGGHGWGVRSSASDSKFTPHKNIVIRDNYVSQSNTDYGCNTIYVTGAQHVLIERNVCEDSGTSAIEAYNSDDVLIQYNETFGTVKKAGGTDSNGIDADRATTNTIIQYNYVHDNGDGILLCQFAFGDSVVRYNVVANNSRWALNLHSDSNAKNQTYNNLFYVQGLGSGNLIGSSGGSEYLTSGSYKLTNNIFHSSRPQSLVSTGSAVSYTTNFFSGVTSTGSGAKTGSPGFASSGALPKGDASGPALDQLAGFQLMSSSSAVGAGTHMANNGGKDFWGNALYQGQPDMGPGER